MENKDFFKKLAELNVNDLTETKNGLTYLSWANAWGKFLEIDPSATYEVKLFDDERGCKVPYCGNGTMGYMVFTSVSANGITRDCYLPVMDNNNKTMKDEQYEYSTKSGMKSVEPVSMFDVNKAIMRCLAKNLAMFGLGLYIYAGEDLPQSISEPITNEQIKEFGELGVNVPNALKRFKVSKIEQLTKEQAQFCIDGKKSSMEG